MSKAAELANLIGNINAGGGGVNRNVIINGAMTVAQRGTSFTLENNSPKFPVDRFLVNDVNSSSGEATVSQSTTAPTDFKNSLKVDVTAAHTSLGANAQYKIEHRIEGQNIKHFNFGTSSAKTLALSFYIRSNKTGNTQVGLMNSANNRAYVATFTIDSANTWEKKEITIEGDQSGTWLDTNGIGLRLRWGSFGSTYQTSSVNQWIGSNVMSRNDSPINFFDSTDNELYLTGVQLEIGQNPTTFEHEPVERTLAKCQRYTYRINSNTTDDVMIGAGYHKTTTSFRAIVHFPVTMRSGPTVTTNDADLTLLRDTTSDASVTLDSSLDESEFSCGLNINGVDSTAVGEGGILRLDTAGTGFMQFDAEL